MASTLTITDESASGMTLNTMLLDISNDQITARDLIRERVFEEVRRYNAALPEFFRGLVQPSEAEQTLNGSKLPRERKVDPKKQFDEAMKAFTRNGFLILVNDRQISDPDEAIHVSEIDTVSFIKLVPLVGG